MIGMKRKKLLLTSKIATLTQKKYASIHIKGHYNNINKNVNFEKLRANKFSKTIIVMHFVLLQSLSMDSTAFFYAQFFLYLLMFLEVKKIFSLNLVAGPCDSLNFDKIL